MPHLIYMVGRTSIGHPLVVVIVTGILPGPGALVPSYYEFVLAAAIQSRNGTAMRAVMIFVWIVDRTDLRQVWTFRSGKRTGRAGLALG